MARNGVWELEKLVIRYCPTGGSSRGVREFVEDGLIPFARKNPQIFIKTALKSGHPILFGRYVTDYCRKWCLKNMDRDEVEARFQEMRDTLGRKVPRHSEIANRVVEQKKISVQGVWRNQREFKYELPEEIERKKQLERKFGMQHLVDDIGLSGIVHITKDIIQREENERQAGLDSLPKKYKVHATE